MMIETVLGSEYAEKVLMFIFIRGKGYASEIASFFGADLATIQNQLNKFERGGVLVSLSVGRTRVFTLNPAWVFLPELSALLEKAFSYYPPGEMERYKLDRRRPRRSGKPL